MATALLAIKYFRTGHDLVAAGFMVFAIAEGVIMSGTAAGPVASVPSFAAGAALWSTALLLVSIPRFFTLPVRLLGLASAILFAVTAARIFWGEPLLPTSAPLPFYAYPVLVMTFMGWIWSLLREGEYFFSACASAKRPFRIAKPNCSGCHGSRPSTEFLRDLIIKLAKPFGLLHMIGCQRHWSACHVRRKTEVQAPFHQSGCKVRGGIGRAPP